MQQEVDKQLEAVIGDYINTDNYNDRLIFTHGWNAHKQSLSSIVQDEEIEKAANNIANMKALPGNSHWESHKDTAIRGIQWMKERYIQDSVDFYMWVLEGEWGITTSKKISTRQGVEQLYQIYQRTKQK